MCCFGFLFKGNCSQLLLGIVWFSERARGPRKDSYIGGAIG